MVSRSICIVACLPMAVMAARIAAKAVIGTGETAKVSHRKGSKSKAAESQPFWGCGLLGDLPGMRKDGAVDADTQQLIDGLKVTNKKDGKVVYWNWNLAPMDDPLATDGHQYLTDDFIFMPEDWGMTAPDPQYVRDAGAYNFLDSNGIVSHATMSDLFLGANEPDIYGSCMGNMMGACTAPCTSAEVGAGDCPIAHLDWPQGTGGPNSKGHCDCWTDSHGTGVGFWNLPGTSGNPWQPLPTCWDHSDCITVVMDEWKKLAQIVSSKGYKYLSAPLMAVNMEWMEKFVAHACSGCSDVSCGCPSHVGWHFYANDCRPEDGGYADFQAKLDATVALMEKYPHLQGAIVNEVGMLNCAMDTPDAICEPNGPYMKYPANQQPNKQCPVTESLPKGLASFVEELLLMVSRSKTADGRRTVVSFTWFNLDSAGGTYNLRTFGDDGSLNELGRQYIASCQAWASGAPAPPSPIPTPPPPTPPPSPGPTTQCNVGDVVLCTGSTRQYCAGNQCCPDGSTCPSATEAFNRDRNCPTTKTSNCLVGANNDPSATTTAAPTPAPPPKPTPSPSPVPTPTPTPKPTVGTSSCAAHPACSGLVGNCCPSDDGSMLACCGATPAPPPSASTQTCDDVWNVDAGGYTCGARITWIQDNQSKSRAEAEDQVAGEFPDECGPCLS